jgi:hypothetical protein
VISVGFGSAVTRFRRTYRDVDGLSVESTWRYVFTRNMDTYFLTDLVIDADGAITCGIDGLTDLGADCDRRAGGTTTSGGSSLNGWSAAAMWHLGRCHPL